MKHLLTAFFILISVSIFAQNSLNKRPHKDSIAKYIGNGVYLTVTGCIGDEAAQKIILYFTLTNPSKSHQKIKINPWNEVPVGAYDNEGNQFPFGTVNLANQTSYGQVETELPTNLKVKGYITFINVHNKPKKLAHISIPISSGNWPNASDEFQEIIEINNVSVNWNTQDFPYVNAEDIKSKIDFTAEGSNKNICNGLDFYYTGCNGDPAAQTTTVFFTIANSNKSNQKITIDPFAIKRAFAFDNIGNQYAFSNLNIGNENSDGIIECMIPTGLFVKGSITFKNVLPIVNSLGIVNFSIKSENWNGSGNETEDAVQLNNIAINWNSTTNPNYDFKPIKKNSGKIIAENNEVSIVPNKIRRLENNLDLVILRCEGDSVDQTVTIFYTLANPRKPHQKIQLQSLDNEPIIAFDANGNQYNINNINLEESNSESDVSSVLPTGFTINGSVTFVNVFPLVNNFSLVKIPIIVSNNSGNSNDKTETVYLKNMKIKWLRIKPKETGKEDNQQPKTMTPLNRRRN